MENKIKLLAKCAVFVIILIASSLIIEGYLDNQNFPQFGDLEKSLQNNTEIIYFGDSTMRWTGQNDTDKRPIGDMLRNALENTTVSVISSNAYHLGVYESFSNYICNSKNKPKIVIFPINLRSFSPEWDTRPQYQFKKETQQIQTKNNVFINLWNRFLGVFGGKQEGEDEILWKNQIVYYNTTPVGRVIDFNFKMTEKDPDLQEKIKKKFIYQYLYSLNSSHPKLSQLKNTINNYKNCGVNILVYVTPIDYIAGSRYLADFSKIAEANIQKIISVGESQGLDIKNMAFDLESKNFTYILNPSEHLDEYGRSYISSELSKEIEGKNI